MISFKRHKGRVSSIPGLPQTWRENQGINLSHTNSSLTIQNNSDVIIISKEMGRVTESQLKSIILTFKRLISNTALRPAIQSGSTRTSIDRGISIKNRIYTYLPVTRKPLEVRMGKGKGSINHYIARIRPNTVLLEISNVPIELSLAKFQSIINKLPIKCLVVRSPITTSL